MSNEDFDEYSHINISNLSEDNFNNNTLNNRVSNEDSLSIFDKGYHLRPIEAFLINKLLPFSVKMESEDNYKFFVNIMLQFDYKFITIMLQSGTYTFEQGTMTL